MSMIDKLANFLSKMIGPAETEVHNIKLNRKQERMLNAIRRREAGKRRAAYHRALQRRAQK